MTKGRPKKPLRQRFPRAPELQSLLENLPRFDDPYRCGRPPYTVEFRRDGTVLVGGEPGTWEVDPHKTLHIATPRWRCDGAIGIERLLLVCSLEGSPTTDLELELRLGPEIHHPDLRGVRRTGTVTWWSDEKGNGRITADDGEWFWFHHTSASGPGYVSFREGDRVSFIWDGGHADHGLRAAKNVLRIDQPT
jgi:cold shock CspA family protein